MRDLGGRPFDEVRVWSIVDRRGDKKYQHPWVVRWLVNHKIFQKSFRTRREADRYRSRLLLAQSEDERFSGSNGEPQTWQPVAKSPLVYEWARRWLAEQWPEWQPRTRNSAVEAISRMVPLAVRNEAPVDGAVRVYLVDALRPDRAPEVVNDSFEQWMNKWCLRLDELSRENLAEVDQKLGLRLDGGALANETSGRYRKNSRACIRRAVDLGLLATDPWPPTVRGANSRKVRRKKKAINVNLLPDPATMRKLLAAMRSHQPASGMYQLMTSIMYYGGLRPSEVVMLKKRSFYLPAEGWGKIYVTSADISFDEPGEPKMGERTVPIPRVLVGSIHDWVEEFNLSDESLLFRTRTGKRPRASNWSRCWHRAQQVVGHTGLRLYDCRHTAATTWLRAGMPLGEAARRLGHSVETLVSTYVGALEGDEVASNEMVDEMMKRWQI